MHTQKWYNLQQVDKAITHIVEEEEYPKIVSVETLATYFSIWTLLDIARVSEPSFFEYVCNLRPSINAYYESLIYGEYRYVSFSLGHDHFRQESRS